LSGAGPVTLAVAVLAAVVVIAVGVPRLANPAVPQAGQQIGYVPPPQPRLALFVGDSYTVGSAEGGNGPQGWPAIVSRHFGWQEVDDSVGGSGYTTPGTGTTTFPQRAKLETGTTARVIIVWGSRNDIGTDTSNLPQIRSAALATYRALKQGAPHAKIVVVGPAWVNGAPPASFLAARDVERAAARSVGLPFIDPLAERWFAGRYASLIGADHIHPTDAGHRRIAALMIADLDRLHVR
jgi:lysophospholipase L1-like esterase